MRALSGSRGGFFLLEYDMVTVVGCRQPTVLARRSVGICLPRKKDKPETSAPRMLHED